MNADLAKETLHKMNRLEHDRLTRLQKAARAGELIRTKQGVFETNSCNICGFHHKVSLFLDNQLPCPGTEYGKNFYTSHTELRELIESFPLNKGMHVNALMEAKDHMSGHPVSEATAGEQRNLEDTKKGSISNIVDKDRFSNLGPDNSLEKDISLHVLEEDVTLRKLEEDISTLSQLEDEILRMSSSFANLDQISTLELKPIHELTSIPKFATDKPTSSELELRARSLIPRTPGRASRQGRYRFNSNPSKRISVRSLTSDDKLLTATKDDQSRRSRSFGGRGVPGGGGGGGGGGKGIGGVRGGGRGGGWSKRVGRGRSLSNTLNSKSLVTQMREDEEDSEAAWIRHLSNKSPETILRKRSQSNVEKLSQKDSGRLWAQRSQKRRAMSTVDRIKGTRWEASSSKPSPISVASSASSPKTILTATAKTTAAAAASARMPKPAMRSQSNLTTGGFPAWGIHTESRSMVIQEEDEEDEFRSEGGGLDSEAVRTDYIRSLYMQEEEALRSELAKERERQNRSLG